MIDNYAKMRRVQAKAKEYLEGKGWKVWMIHHTRFQKDIFSLFDGLAIDKKLGVALIQIRSGSLPSMKPYKLFKKAYPTITIILLAWVNRKGWKERIL